MNDDIVSIFSLAALQVFSPPVEQIPKRLRTFEKFKVIMDHYLTLLICGDYGSLSTFAY